MKVFTKTALLVAIALLFHIIGFAGIGIWHNDMIINATPFHLLLMFGLLILSYNGQLKPFMIWAGITYVIGFAVEWIGVHTGLLFGNYSYGTVLGIKLSGIPLLIGVNWVLVLSGALAVARVMNSNIVINSLMAAAIATGYDWMLEGVAVKLGYWQWEGGVIPGYNYLCWFGVSLVMSLIANKMKIRANKFSLWLFIIQLVFFILLNITLWRG